MILSGEQLIELVKKRKVFGEEPPWEHFLGWQFDLTLGKTVFRTGAKKPIMMGAGEYAFDDVCG